MRGRSLAAVPAMAVNTTYPAPPANSAVSDGTVGPGEQFVFAPKAELATAVQERLVLPVVVVNDHGYTEIRDGMLRAGIPPTGVDLHTPDFAALGRAVGAGGVTVRSEAELVDAVLAALDADGPTVVEVDAAAVVAADATRSPAGAG